MGSSVPRPHRTLATAFCACELPSQGNSPTRGSSRSNRHYIERRAAWGIFRDEVTPVARSNVCPEIDPPATASFYAFSYTVPSGHRRDAQLCRGGSGEAREGPPAEHSAAGIIGRYRTPR
jgi:hypothetical protein